VTSDSPRPVLFEPSLGRETRAGDWDQLSRGTFRSAGDALHGGDPESAAVLVEQAVLEAEELHDIFDRWPEDTRRWLLEEGASDADLDREVTRLTGVIGLQAMDGIDREWSHFTTAVERAARLCRGGAPEAGAAIDEARTVWLAIHDRAVDRVSGMVDIAVRLVGEDRLGALWDHLMADWYAVHRQRYSPDAQDWPESARQLMVAIVDGFHAHLTGPDRSGDLEVIQEPDRIGFRFAPCGSGGRALAAGITDGKPRAGAPYGFAVTTEKHDWAWNKIGICSYCVHCCQLNVLMPIDALGFPTRVIEPPTWPAQTADPSCTWWVYRHPSLVPAAVYEQVGRTAPSHAASGEVPAHD